MAISSSVESTTPQTFLTENQLNRAASVRSLRIQEIALYDPTLAATFHKVRDFASLRPFYKDLSTDERGAVQNIADKINSSDPSTQLKTIEMIYRLTVDQPLPKDTPSNAFGGIYHLSGRPNTRGDMDWGRNHAFDNVRILALALRIESLPPEQRARFNESFFTLHGEENPGGARDYTEVTNIQNPIANAEEALNLTLGSASSNQMQSPLPHSASSILDRPPALASSATAEMPSSAASGMPYGGAVPPPPRTDSPPSYYEATRGTHSPAASETVSLDNIASREDLGYIQLFTSSFRGVYPQDVKAHELRASLTPEIRLATEIRTLQKEHPGRYQVFNALIHMACPGEKYLERSLPRWHQSILSLPQEERFKTAQKALKMAKVFPISALATSTPLTAPADPMSASAGPQAPSTRTAHILASDSASPAYPMYGTSAAASSSTSPTTPADTVFTAARLNWLQELQDLRHKMHLRYGEPIDLNKLANEFGLGILESSTRSDVLEAHPENGMGYQNGDHLPHYNRIIAFPNGGEVFLHDQAMIDAERGNLYEHAYHGDPIDRTSMVSQRNQAKTIAGANPQGIKTVLRVNNHPYDQKTYRLLNDNQVQVAEFHAYDCNSTEDCDMREARLTLIYATTEAPKAFGLDADFAKLEEIQKKIKDESSSSKKENIRRNELLPLLSRIEKKFALIPKETWFNRAFQELDKAAAGGKVSIHCTEGKSRSSTILTAWLMSRLNLPLDQVLPLVKAKRGVVMPCPAFMELLRAYERH